MVGSTVWAHCRTILFSSSTRLMRQVEAKNQQDLACEFIDFCDERLGLLVSRGHAMDSATALFRSTLLHYWGMCLRNFKECKRHSELQ